MLHLGPARGVLSSLLMVAACTGAAAGQDHAGVPFRVRSFASGADSTPERLWTDLGLFASLGATSVFVAEGTWGIGRELWITDGTDSGPRLLKDLDARTGRDLMLGSVMTYRDGGTPKAAFLGADEVGVVVVETDGTAEGSTVSRPSPGSGLGFAGSLGGRPLFFVGSIASVEESLWIAEPEGNRLLAAWGRGSSRPLTIGEAGRWCYFWRSSPSAVFELCRTDGTPEGTGPVPGVPNYNVAAHTAAVVGDRVFLTAQASGLTRAYVTGGAEGRTREIAMPSGVVLSASAGVVPLPSGDGVLFGTSVSLVLVKSDGTDEGTHIFMSGVGAVSSPDWEPFPFPQTISSPNGPVTVFNGTTQASGREPWVTDGTVEGTRMLVEMAPGTAAGRATVLGLSQGRMWFGMGDRLLTSGIWSTDGTPEGTRRIALDGRWHWTWPDSYIGGPYSSSAGDRLLFRPDVAGVGTLWAFDARTNTRSTVDPGPGQPVVNGPGVGAPIVVGGRALFTLGSRWQPGSLYRSEGCAAGTLPVLNTGVAGAEALTSVGSLGWFGLTVPGSGWQLWRTDGLESGTFTVGTAPESTPRAFGPLLSGADGVVFHSRGVYTASEAPNSVRRLASPEVTRAGEVVVDSLGRVYYAEDVPGESVRITMIDPFTGVSTPLSTLTGSGRLNLQAAGDLVYFSHPRDAKRLWRTDGTPEGTREVLGAYPVGPAGRAFAGGVLLFSRGEDTEIELLAADPSDRLSVLGRFRSVEAMRSFGQRAIILADDGVRGVEPWISDGTPQGTAMVVETVPGPRGAADAGVRSSQRLAWGWRLPTMSVGARYCYFSVLTDDLSAHAWLTDGTAAGTRRLGTLPERIGDLPLAPSDFVETEGAVYFRGWTPERGVELYAVRFCEADFTTDGFLDFFDYLGFTEAFEAGTPDSDFNGDGFVDFFDYDGFIGAFDRGC